MARTSFLLAVVFSALPLAVLPAAALTTPPIIIPDAASIPLDEIGIYGVDCQYRGDRGGRENRFPLGWSGDFEDQTGIALKSVGKQNGREAFLEHPPWKNGFGSTFQEFRFQLPPLGKVQKISLGGATMMRADALAAPGEKQKSDGVVFRVIANGKTLLEEQRVDSQWKPFDFDLTAYAGQVLSLRFETDCGPKNDASFDFALWGNRQLVLQGFVPRKVTHPAALPLDLKRLYPTQSGSAAPPSGYAGKVTTLAQPGGGTLTYAGPDGTLQYQWSRPLLPIDPPLGNWRLKATQQGAKSAEIVPFATDSRLKWVSAATFLSSRMGKTPGALTCVSTYQVGGTTVTLRTTAKLSGKSLVLDISCDAPELATFDAGRWGPILRRRAVTLPYYTGQVFYLEKENLFVNAALDWTVSSASYQDGTTAVYRSRTDGTYVPLRERVVFSAAWHALETLPNIPNPPSPFKAHLGNRMVLDIWSYKFAGIENTLRNLHDNGITDCEVIIHVWQHDGYDNGLPGHVPANEGQGGSEAMKSLVSAAKRLGYDISLHENYADYYPNYANFNPDDIVLRPTGERELAWYNEGTKMQSFAEAPTAMLKYAKEQSTQIKALYGPNADYLDVHSSTPPWFHQDYRARTKDAGTFRATWDATRALWAFERQNYGGPVLGEGNNHWYWSGWLDGVEAQFGSGWPGGEGQSAPIAVDFDLLKIHPLQFNHGMGYYERWWKNRNWAALPPMAVLDQYRMQEIIYGHAGFLGDNTYANLPLAWLEYNLMTPVSARYATAKPIKIEYQVGGHWVDSDEAAKSGDQNRARVTYDNGLTVTANNKAAPLQVDALTLPQHGWMATGAGVTAWTALRGGVIADYAQTPDSTFANARRAADWAQSGLHRVRPSVLHFEQSAPREFTLTYGWQVSEQLPDGVRSFVHFVGAKNEILFQGDHALPPNSSSWKVGDTVNDGPLTTRLPNNLPDGDYGIRIGMLQADGSRMALQGSDDGGSRIRLGTIHVAEGGKTITYLPQPPTPDRGAIFEQRLNEGGKIIDFGDVRTDGSVLVRREKGEWVLRALPRVGNFSVQLSAARFGTPASVRCLGGPSVSVTPRKAGAWWSLKLNGAAEYHWK